MIDLEIEKIKGFYNTEYKFTDIATDSVCDIGNCVNFVVHGDPNGNCQTFGIAYANEFTAYGKKDMKDILKAVCRKVNKHQMLLDITEYDSYAILKNLKPFSKKQNIKRYISTNGSKMMLVRVVLDRNKIFK